MLPSIPQIFCLGVNHNSAPAHIRETFFIPDVKLPAALEATKKQYQFEELAALSTCNRFELFGVMPSNKKLGTDDLLKSFQFLQQMPNALRAGHDLQKYYYLYHNEEAVRHLFTVAASLDSMVVGETQITGQFKDALSLAQQAKTIGSVLNRLGQEALETSKKIRSRTEIGKKSVSVCHSAIELDRRVYAYLTDHQITVVGAGNMARIAAEYLKHLGCKNIAVLNRTKDKARQLAESIGSKQYHGIEDLSKALKESAIVITATQAQDYLITPDHLQNVKRDRPLVLLDISIPRNINPSCNDFSDVYLFDIDDIQQSIAKNLEERRGAIDEAMEFIDSGVQGYVRGLTQTIMGPLLTAYRNNLEVTAKSQINKTLTRPNLKNLTPDQKAHLDDTAKNIADFCTARLAELLKNLPEHLSSEVIRVFSTSLTTSINAGSKDE